MEEEKRRKEGNRRIDRRGGKMKNMGNSRNSTKFEKSHYWERNKEKEREKNI